VKVVEWWSAGVLECWSAGTMQGRRTVGLLHHCNRFFRGHPGYREGPKDHEAAGPASSGATFGRQRTEVLRCGLS